MAQKKKSSVLSGCAGCLVISVVLIGVGIWGTGFFLDRAGDVIEMLPEAPPPEPFGDELTAKVMSEDFVAQHLNFPDEAEYPHSEKTAQFDEDLNTWLVRGIVKTKNAFGVRSTHRYVVEIHVVSPGSHQWMKRMVAIDGMVVYQGDSVPTTQ